MDKKAARLKHIEGHINMHFKPELIDSLMVNLKREFNVSACAMLLASYAEARSIYAWFVDENVVSHRRWASTAADFTWKSLSAKHGTIPPYPMLLRMLFPMLSNDQAKAGLFVDAANNSIGNQLWKPKQDEFLLKNFIMAWVGDWSGIKKLCEVLAFDTYSSVKPLHVADFMFLNAIADQDHVAMQYALHKMLEKKELRRHSNFESGYTEDLISTRAVIWCKLARMHKIEIDVESDLVPREWMPWDDGPYPPFENLMIV